MSDVIVAPDTRDLDTLAGQLARWMEGRLSDATGIRVDNLTYPRGAGRSHETILFDVHWSEKGTARSLGCVVRIKPTRYSVYVDTLFDEQYRLMKVIHDGGHVRVARPLWFEEDPSILGAPFFVMEKKHGRVPVSYPPYAQTGWVAEATPAQRARMWEAGVRQLAAVQSVPLSDLAFLQGPEGARDGLAQEWDKYVRFVELVSRDQRWPVLDAALDLLRETWPANQPAGLVWGDARIGNMMFDESFDVVAVMDWEQPSLGGALHDLGWWLTLSEMMHGANSGRPHLEGMGTRDDTLRLWEEITGISTADIEWYEHFTALKTSCLAINMAGLSNEPPPDVSWLARRLKVEDRL